MKKVWTLILLSVIVLAACNNDKKEGSDANKEANSENIEFGKIDIEKLPKSMTPEVLWMLGRLNDVQLSPDGSSLLFGIKYYNLEHNKGNNDLFSMPIAGGKYTQLTHSQSSEYNARFTPDGKKIAYLAVADNAVQLWTMDLDGENATVISDIEEGVNSFKFSPDGKKILFTKDVKLDQTANEVHTDLPKAEARIIGDMMYRHWDNWHDFAYSHIFVADYQEGTIGELTDIMKDEKFDTPMNPWGELEQINWSADGNKIAYCCKKMNNREYAVSTNSEIYIYELNSKETINLTKEGFEGYDFDPVFSPDGKFIAWRSMEEAGFEADKNRIIVHNFETNENINYSENFDQGANNITWNSDGSKIYFITDIHATKQIFSLDLASKTFDSITKGDHNYNSFILANDQIIGTKNTMIYPEDIFSISMNGEETQLTQINKEIFDHIDVPSFEKRWVKTPDGKDMLVWVVLPPNFDKSKKYPALLYCQGGPQSAVSQFFSYRWNFHIMAANNYVIVAPNRRGLPGFGQEWNDQISGDYGGQNMKDYNSAIDDVAKEDYVDNDRIGAIGASYGGFSVYWLAGHNQDKKFKAFIAHCGMFNLEAQYGTTEEFFFVNKDLGGAYWEEPKPESYDFSPHKFVQNWNTPIMIVTGARDFRIPYVQSMDAFNAAQLRGIPSKLLFFPDETHFVVQPQNAVLWQREFFGWLDTYLK